MSRKKQTCQEVYINYFKVNRKEGFVCCKVTVSTCMTFSFCICSNVFFSFQDNVGIMPVTGKRTYCQRANMCRIVPEILYVV